MIQLNNKTEIVLNAFIKNPTGSVLLHGYKSSVYVAIDHLSKLLLGSSFASRQIFIEPEKSSVSIEQIRQIKKLINSKINNTKNDNHIDRIIIINGYNIISAEAQNSLLKVLEEPTEGILICIAGSNTESFLPTILSRLQKIPVLPLSQVKSEQILKDIINDPEERKKIFLITKGEIGEIEQIITHKKFENNDIQVAKEFLKKSTFDRLLDQNIYDNTESLLTLLRSLQMLAEAGLHQNSTQADTWIKIIKLTKSQIQQCNNLVSPKLLFTQLSIEL